MTSLQETLKEVGLLVLLGQWPEATARLRSALAQEPENATLRRRLAAALAAQSEWPEAHGLYAGLLHGPEDGAGLRAEFADVLLAQGQHGQALRVLEQLADLSAGDRRTDLPRGRALLGLDRATEALAPLQRAAATNGAAWRYLVQAAAASDPTLCGQLLQSKDAETCDDAAAATDVAGAANAIAKPDVAENWARRAVALDPLAVGAWLQWGLAARALGKKADAVAAFRRAHELLPEIPQIAILLIASAIDDGRTHEVKDVVPRLRAAANLTPNDFVLCGMATWLNGERELAIDFFTRALAGASEDGAIEDAVLDVITDTSSYAETRPFADALLAKALRDDSALLRYAHRSIHLSDWREREVLRGRIAESLDRQIAKKSVHANMLRAVAGYGLDYAHDMKICRQMALAYEPPIVTIAARRPRDRMRVGWIQVATSFHSTMIATRNLVERSDRTRFEVFGYARRDRAYGPDHPAHAFQNGFRASFDRFTDLTGLSDETAAETIAADDLDVLIDMQGFNENNNMGVVARRPARITALYYGFCHSTGSSRVDYLFSDRQFMTPSFAALGSEKIVYLPGAQLAPTLGRISDQPLSRRDMGLPADAVVHCNFNNPWKHDPVSFASWMRILRAVPNAVLWLASWNDSTVVNLRAGATAAGIDPQRLVFGQVAEHSIHLKRLGLTDLALDGFYNGGGVTTLDTLWAGVPLVSLVGLVDITMARMGASLLAAANLPELVVNSVEAYETLVIALCRDPERRAKLRAHLVNGRKTLPVFDIDGAARHVDRACELVFENWAAGRPPRDLEVEPAWSAWS